MRFRDWWIFDLSAYHDFWKSHAIGLAQKNQWSHDLSPWGALHKAYKIHLFSPTDQLEDFARDFHDHRRHPISSKNRRDIFAHFRRLGLHRVGHLHRLPLASIQKRFGTPWAEFLRGVLDPQSAPWVWEPFRVLDPIEWSGDLEEPSAHADHLLEFIRQGLKEIAHQQAYTKFKKLEIRLFLTDPETLSFEFPHPIFLERDLPWVRYLLQERLFRLCLDAAVFKVKISLEPLFSFDNIQLSLFPDKRSPQISEFKLKSFLEKWENQGHKIFKPIATTSLLPEKSWQRHSAHQLLETQPSFSRGVLRPLIVHPTPHAISPPEGKKDLTEKLEWFDDDGVFHKREYFIVRDAGVWAWVFCNEKSEWFKHGIIE